MFLLGHGLLERTSFDALAGVDGIYLGGLYHRSEQQEASEWIGFLLFLEPQIMFNFPLVGEADGVKRFRLLPGRMDSRAVPLE